MKILVAVSNNRSDLNIQFVRSLIELVSYTSKMGHQTVLTFFDYYDIATMRNHAVKKAFETEMDYVFFLDADMIYPYDSIVRLLGHQKECVAGFYVTRRLPTQPVHFKSTKLDGTLGAEENRIAERTGLVEQACGGFGGVLVSINVLKQMKYPFFRVMYGDDESIMVGEDIYFFIELEKLGIKAYLDCDLKYGHVVNGAMFPDGRVRLV